MPFAAHTHMPGRRAHLATAGIEQEGAGTLPKPLHQARAGQGAQVGGRGDAHGLKLLLQLVACRGKKEKQYMKEYAMRVLG